MAIDLNSGTGLFNRLGRLFYLLELGEAFGAGTSSGNLPVEFNDLLEKFDGEANNDVRAAVIDLPSSKDQFDSTVATWHQSLIQAAQRILIEMADADDPLPAKNVEEALKLLIAQMESGSETVDANEPSVVSTAGASNDGNGVAVLSLLDGYGTSLENSLAEDIECEVSSAATAGSETWRCRGERNLATNRGSVHYPSGSGSDTTISTIDPATLNLLTNGTFESFTTNDPDNWTIDTGSAGTTVDDETTSYFRGSTALKFVGNGSELTQISQDITSVVNPLTPYVLNVWTRVDSAGPAAGTLVIDLFDGSSVIQDEAGTANSLSIDLTSESDSYASHNAVFRLPTPLPAQVTMRVRLSAALTSTKNAFIDDLVLYPMTELYTDGPFAAFVTGSTGFSSEDTHTFAIANDYRGKFQTRFKQAFNITGLSLPSVTGGTETIADTLIG